MADASRRGEALKTLERAQTMRLAGFDNADHAAPMWLALLGDREDALSALERNYARGPSGSERLWAPAFDAIRDDPRFQKILAHIGVPFPSAGAAQISSE